MKIPHDLLGELTLVEFYEFYDVPRLFVTKDAAGTPYIHFWCDSDEGYDSYLIARLTQETFEALREKRIDYRSAFLEGLLLSREYFEPQLGGQFVSMRMVYDEARDQGLLPVSGIFVEYIGTYESNENGESD